eukprot:3093036-Lingulodinium_polyedra.AAC.1
MRRLGQRAQAAASRRRGSPHGLWAVSQGVPPVRAWPAARRVAHKPPASPPGARRSRAGSSSSTQAWSHSSCLLYTSPSPRDA